MKEFIEKLNEKLTYLLNNFGEHCEEWGSDKEGDCHRKSCSDCVLTHAILIVNQLAEEYKGGWIPVDRTLPKKSGYYTVTEEQYSLDMRRKIGIRVSHEVQFDAEEQMWHRAKSLKVIAWKEHEAPYQTKGE